MRKLINRFKLLLKYGVPVATATSLMLAPVVQAQTFPSNTLKFGNGAASDKKIIINKGSGAANPAIKWNETTDKLQFSNDGSLYKDFGSGSGSGGSGFSVLSNPGFEDGATINWASSGGTYAEVTSGSNLLFGEKSVTFDASSSGQYVQSDLYTVPVGLQGGNCGAHIYYKGGDANLALKVLDGSANVLATQTLAAATYTTKASVSFPCPTSGQFRVRVESTADAAIVALDNGQLGELELLKVAEATFIGSAYFPPTTNCTWNTTSTSYSPFTSDADCPAPTIEFNPFGYIQATDADLPQITLNNLPAGNYKVIVEGGADTSGSAANYAGLSVSDSITRSGDHEFYINNTDAYPWSLTGMFNYSSAGTRTYDLRGKKTGGTTLRIGSGGSYTGPRFLIYRFPLTSELAVSPSTSPSFWSGYHASTCTWSRTSTSFGDFTDDATCSLVERANVNFGTVTTVGSVSPAISFTPARAGWYKVCASFNPSVPVSVENIQYRMVDGASNVLDDGMRRSYASVGEAVGSRQTLCGKLNAVSVSTQTIKLQAAFGSGTGTIASIGSPSIQWEIESLSQAIPAPLLVNSVVSDYAGVWKVNAASIGKTADGTSCSSSPCDVYRSSGNWISSVTRSGTGAYTVNFAAGTFSTAPHCFVQTRYGAICGRIDNITTSSAEASTFVCNTTAASDSFWSLRCEGPR